MTQGHTFMQPRNDPQSIRFGLFELDLVAREIRKGGRKLRLQDK